MFQSELLNSSTVCSNCFGRRRREVVRPTRSGDEHYHERFPRTSVEYVPCGREESMSDSRTIFCECGADSAFTRIWTVYDIDDARFRELVQQTIRTLGDLGHEVDRKAFAMAALQEWRRVPTADEAGPRRPSVVDDALSMAVDEAVERDRGAGAVATA